LSLRGKHYLRREWVAKTPLSGEIWGKDIWSTEYYHWLGRNLGVGALKRGSVNLPREPPHDSRMVQALTAARQTSQSASQPLLHDLDWSRGPKYCLRGAGLATRHRLRFCFYRADYSPIAYPLPVVAKIRATHERD